MAGSCLAGTDQSAGLDAGRDRFGAAGQGARPKVAAELATPACRGGSGRKAPRGAIGRLLCRPPLETLKDQLLEAPAIIIGDLAIADTVNDLLQTVFQSGAAFGRGKIFS